MAAEYQLWLSDPYGARVAALPLDAVSKLTYTRSVNAVGSLTIECDRNVIPDAWVREDARIEIWRKADGGAWKLEGDGPWLLSGSTKGVSERAGRYWKLKAESMMTILKRRHVLYFAEQLHALYTHPAEQFLKYVWYYNFQGSVSPYNTVGTVIGRDLTAYFIYTPPAGLGPSITKQMAWRNVLPVMQEIAKASFGGGTPLYFDIVSVGTGTTFEFRTYIGQRGTDRSTGTGKLVVSPERGSFGGTVESEFDWSDVANVIAAGGEGQQRGRIVAAVSDAVSVGKSPFGRREGWVDCTQEKTYAGTAIEAVTELRARRPKKVLTGDLISVPGAAYGLDWGHGDLIIAELEHEQYLSRVDVVSVTLAGGKETIKAALRGENS